MEQLNSNSSDILKRLYDLSAQVNKYHSNVVKQQVIARMQGEAEANGYSYFHYLQTGIWLKHEAIETVSREVLKPFQTAKGKIETETVLEIETEKSKPKPFEGTFEVETEKTETVETVCLSCQKPFQNARKNKRFCNTVCKNNFNNSKRK